MKYTSLPHIAHKSKEDAIKYFDNPLIKHVELKDAKQLAKILLTL